MKLELWAAVVNNCDNNQETVLGIYTSQGKAEHRCSVHAKSVEGEDPKYYDTKPVYVDEPWS